MNVIDTAIICFLLFMYYVLKIYYNQKMKIIIIAINVIPILCIIVDAIWIGNQELFEYMFALECVHILITIYYLFDKSNYEMYHKLAEIKAIPIIMGFGWFFTGKKEVNRIVEFFDCNKKFQYKSGDINIILIDRNQKSTDVCFLFSKRADVDFYKEDIVNNSSYKTTSKGSVLIVHFERENKQK